MSLNDVFLRDRQLETSRLNVLKATSHSGEGAKPHSMAAFGWKWWGCATSGQSQAGVNGDKL